MSANYSLLFYLKKRIQWYASATSMAKYLLHISIVGLPVVT